MTHPEYPTLFSPMRVGNVVYKNRIFRRLLRRICFRPMSPIPPMPIVHIMWKRHAAALLP